MQVSEGTLPRASTSRGVASRRLWFVFCSFVQRPSIRVWASPVHPCPSPLPPFPGTFLVTARLTPRARASSLEN